MRRAAGRSIGDSARALARLVAVSVAVLIAAIAAQPAGAQAPAPDRATVVSRAIGLFVRLPERPDLVYLDGPIVEGAAEALAVLLDGGPEIRTLVLDSSGGDLAEADLVAQLVRWAGLDTLVPPGAVCLSACPLVFAGGVARRADGQLGVHRVAATDPAFPATAETYAGLGRLFAGFGVDPAIADLFAATDHDAIDVLTAAEIARFGLEADRDRIGPLLPVPVIDGASRATLWWSAPTATTAFGGVAWRLAEHGFGPAIEAVVALPVVGLKMLVVIERDAAVGQVTVALLASGDVPVAAVDGFVTGPRSFSGMQPFPATGGLVRDTDPVFWFGWPLSLDQNLDDLATREAFGIVLRLADGSSAVLVLPKGAEGTRVVDAALAAWAATPSVVPGDDMEPLDFGAFYFPSDVEPVHAFALWTALPEMGSGRAEAAVTTGGYTTITLGFERAGDGALVLDAAADAVLRGALGRPVRLGRIQIVDATGSRDAAGSPRAAAAGLFVPATGATAFLADLTSAQTIDFTLVDGAGAPIGVVRLGGSTRMRTVFAAAFAAR